jgi:hypothetical protein
MLVALTAEAGQERLWFSRNCLPIKYFFVT